MAAVSAKKQKLIIEDILSSPDIYARCANILLPEYFEDQYASVVKYINEYYNKYSAVPDFDLIDAEFDIDFKQKKITKDRNEKICDDIEIFCKEGAIKNAMYSSLDDMEKGEYGAILSRMEEAVLVSLKKDFGIEVFESNSEEKLRSLIETFEPMPTGIGGIDGPLGGGPTRKSLTLFSANSGGGKSVMLSNIGYKYALQGKNVLYITLELPAEMVYLRTASIVSGVHTEAWKDNIPAIAKSIETVKTNGVGSYLLTRMPQHSKASDFKSFLKFYETEFDRVPDVFIVDYLDLMDPNMGIRNIGVFEQDKRKSEEVTNILHEYDMVGFSASQQNREALKMESPDQGVIAGGISKVNTVDNYIAIKMDDMMRLEGEMFIYFLKTRSSKGVGKSSVLKFNEENLQISDPNDGPQIARRPAKKRKSEVEDMLNDLKDKPIEIEGLPSDDDFVDDNEPTIEEELMEVAPKNKPINTSKKKQISHNTESLLDLMNSI